MKKIISLICLTVISVALLSQINNEGLAALAKKIRADFKIGATGAGLTTSDGEVLKRIYLKEFNIITVGIYMTSTQPEPGSYKLDNVDELVEFARQNEIEIYFHPLIGGHQYCPKWFNEGNFTAEEQRRIMRDRITTILTRYGDKLKYIDVVNEALMGIDTTGGIIWNEWNEWLKMGWYEGKKYRIPNYLVEAFRMAREIGHKDLKLILNHPCNDTPGAMITEATLKLFEMMRYEDIPIDDIGFQMHIRLLENGTATNNCENNWTKEGFKAILDRYEQAGINVHITEFDVHIQKQPASENHLNIQAQIYRDVLEIAIKSPAVKTFKTWGFTDKYAWKERKLDATPLLFDKSFQPKPAYNAQVQLLKELRKK